MKGINKHGINKELFLATTTDSAKYGLTSLPQYYLVYGRSNHSILVNTKPVVENFTV